MKRLNASAGFSVPELLIVILVLGAIFGVGGYAWSKVSTRSSSTASKTAVVHSDALGSQEQAAAADLDKGWAEYKNNNYGLTFKYPQEWGTVTVSRKALNDERYETNLPYVITFGNPETPFLRIFPSDWKFTPPKQTEWRNQLVREDLEVYQVKVVSDQTKIVAISYSSFSGEVSLAGLKSLVLPKLNATQVEIHKDDSYDAKRPCFAEQKNKYGSMEIMATLDCYPETYRDKVVGLLDSFKAI